MRISFLRWVVVGRMNECVRWFSHFCKNKTDNYDDDDDDDDNDDDKDDVDKTSLEQVFVMLYTSVPILKTRR
jgi:hypothetical protein